MQTEITKIWQANTGNEEFDRIPSPFKKVLSDNMLSDLNGGIFSYEGKNYKLKIASAKKFYDDSGLSFDWDEFPFYPLSLVDKTNLSYLVLDVSKKNFPIFLFDQGDLIEVEKSFNVFLKGLDDTKENPKAGPLSLSELEKIYDKADKLYEADKFNEVIKFLSPLKDKLYQVDVTSDSEKRLHINWIFSTFSFSYVEIEKPELAVQLIEQAEDNFGEFKSLLVTLLVENIRDFDRAEKLVDELLKEDLESFDNWFEATAYKGFLCFERGDLKGGTKAYKEAYKSIPKKSDRRLKSILDLLDNLSDKEVQLKIKKEFKNWYKLK